MSVRRWLWLGLVLSTTAAAVARLYAVLRIDSLDWLEWLLLALFAVLFAWIASSFWTACAGFYARWRNVDCGPPTKAKKNGPSVSPSPSRTAIVMPVHNEDPASVFARMRAVLESVRQEGALEAFDFYVLSDSTDPQCRSAEKAEWRRLSGETAAPARVFYRRRERNVGRKSGNIADFCENWGTLYDYMVVLDADSLMTGRTLVEMARLMDANPRAALIQAPPKLVGGATLFARMQQFASSVYGPVYAAGLAFLQGGEGNYWGHNAIIRVRPFMRHCGLPKLPGRPPLGGEIMSHDFVEAALLRRAGWEVWLAPGLDGSYESPPPTLLDYLKRDRRWCQGNLQHIRLIFARGFPLVTRMHLATGAMSYLSSPLWLLLLIGYGIEAFRLEHAPDVTYVGRYPVLSWPVPMTVTLVILVLATVALLFGPKILSLILALRDRATVREHGGVWALVLGVIAESIFSTLLAPVMMLSQSWFVINLAMGRTVEWSGQQRGTKGIELWTAGRAFAPHVLIAVAAGLAAWGSIPESFWWFTPLLLGLGLAIVLCWATSLAAWGNAARLWRFFLVPSEVTGIPVVDRAEEIRSGGRERGRRHPRRTGRGKGPHRLIFATGRGN